jgi:WD40 repeat protein
MMMTEFDQLRSLKSNQQILLKDSRWLPIDSSIFFTVSVQVLRMWDSNTATVLSESALESGRMIEPHLNMNEVLLVGDYDKFIVRDYVSNTNVHVIHDKVLSAKWSPYKDEYFITGGTQHVKVWDIRRLKSPVYYCGYLNQSNPRKRYKNNGSINIYDDFFIYQDTIRNIDEPSYAMEFSIDGRYIYIKTNIQILKVDLLNAESAPIAMHTYTENCKKHAIKRIHDGFLTNIGKSVTKFSEDFSTRQTIEIKNQIIGFAEIPTDESLEILDCTGKLHKLKVTISGNN